MSDVPEQKTSLRKKADQVKPFRCKNLVIVIEHPDNIFNVGTVIRNVNALGAEKVYVVSDKEILPSDWQEMRETRTLNRASASSIKWTFVKTFSDTNACISHLKKNNYTSLVTSPHLKGRKNTVLHDADYTKYKKLAVWFGNERTGLTDLAINNSAECINIPMFGIIESLNIGTATGIVLYEIGKQRREFQLCQLARKQALGADATET